VSDDSRQTPILPRRAGETDAEKRLREALNRMSGQMMHAVDSAMNLRSAPPHAQRSRHTARNALTAFCSQAMTAFHQANEATLPTED
jgi:hypothetical protein